MKTEKEYDEIFDQLWEELDSKNKDYLMSKLDNLYNEIGENNKISDEYRLKSQLKLLDYHYYLTDKFSLTGIINRVLKGENNESSI